MRGTCSHPSPEALPPTSGPKETQSLTRPALAEITMPCSTPPEIFDLIVGWLRNEPTTLEACCLVSKSWVPRTRRYLFAVIHFFEPRSSILSWTKVFPDPPNSPAQYTRDLTISEPLNAESIWIRSFQHVEKLTVYTVWFKDSGEVSLVQLHGLSPSLNSLCLSHRSLPLSEVFTLACSFPLLQDLTVGRGGAENKSDEWVSPSTSSPRFTGTLHLGGRIHSATRGLLDHPGGLRFKTVVLQCPVEDAKSAMDLVLRCSDTLESLFVTHSSSGMFPSSPEICQCLTTRP